MYIALVVIIADIHDHDARACSSPRATSRNLLNQAGYIAVLAVGMTLVIVIRHIDLSVGFLSGFLGAIAAVSLVYWHMPVYLAIPLVLVLRHRRGPDHGVPRGAPGHPVVRGVPRGVAHLPRGAAPHHAEVGNDQDQQRHLQCHRQRVHPRHPSGELLSPRCAQAHPPPRARGHRLDDRRARSGAGRPSRPTTSRSFLPICSSSSSCCFPWSSGSSRG